LSFIFYKYIQYDYSFNFTFFNFDLLSSITLVLKRSKTVSIRSTSHEKNYFTVVLIYISNEIKLEFVIIFKLKNIFCEVFSNRVKVQVNKKKWINEKKML